MKTPCRSQERANASRRNAMHLALRQYHTFTAKFRPSGFPGHCSRTLSTMARKKKATSSPAKSSQAPDSASDPAVEKPEGDDEETKDPEKPAKKKRKPTAKQLEEAEAAARPRYDPKADRPPQYEGLPASRIISWNVTSLNATLRKDPEALSRLAEEHNADVICLQETKLQDKGTEDAEKTLDLPEWHFNWACSQTRKGYSGTATISRETPISTQIGMGLDAEHDDEGRVITTEFNNFYLVNVYTPNAGEGLKRLSYRVEGWDPTFIKYIAKLKEKKEVIITGDLNCAHQAIDLHSPRTNLKTPGYSPEERESFGKILDTLSLSDCFRRQYPNHVGYTYWSIRSGARKNNKGWRLDYFLVTPGLTDKVHDCFILKDYGMENNLSDHCPIGIIVKV